MSQKTLVILTIILAGLILVISYPLWQKRFGWGTKKSPGQIELNLTAFTKDNTDQILIAKKGEKEKLIRKMEGKWRVNDFDAAETQVASFLAALSKLEVDSLVSQNPANFSNFGVDEKGVIQLDLTRNGQLTQFIIGNAGSVFGTFYLRKKGSNNVYLVKGGLRDFVTQGVDEWRDKTVLSLKKELVKKVVVDNAPDSFTLFKEENGKWRARADSKESEVGEQLMNKFLAALNPLKAVSFLSQKEIREFNQAKSLSIVQIFGSDNRVLASLKLIKKEDEFWGKVAGRDTYYKIALFNLQDVLPSREKLFSS